MALQLPKPLTNADGSLRLPSMQSFIAGFLTVVVSWLWLAGGDVPEGLLNVYLIVIGFFFGDRRNATLKTEPVGPPAIGDGR